MDVRSEIFYTMDRCLLEVSRMGVKVGVAAMIATHAEGGDAMSVSCIIFVRLDREG